MVTKTIWPETLTERKKMSYDEYLDLAGESRLMEWADGEGIIYMPPTNKHQDIVRFLSHLIDSFIQYFGLGVLRFAPFEVPTARRANRTFYL